MTGDLYFNIENGGSPFLIELLESDIPNFTVNTLGEHIISNVPYGVYTLRISDSNGCSFEQLVYVDDTVTTTTTTNISKDSLVIGNTNTSQLIFNETGTNNSGEYIGFPDSNVVTLYLWIRSFSDKPLNIPVGLEYLISSIDDGSEFEFIGLSDEINAEVNQTVVGPSSTILGTINLNAGFIETYFEYTYYKSQSNPEFYITVTPIGGREIIYPNIITKDDAGTEYGVYDPVTEKKIIITYGLLPQ